MFSVHLLKSFAYPIFKVSSRLDSKLIANKKLVYNLNLPMKYNTNLLREIKRKNSNIINKFKQFRIQFKKTDCRAGFSILTSLTGGAVILKNAVFCTATCTANNVSEKSIQPAFDWTKFLELIWQDYWCILGAIVAALVAALMNIQLPIYLGDVINVMSRHMAAEVRGSFSSEMRTPVLNLLGLYMAQSAATFVYIYLLSGVGERLASRLKCLLFSSILRQDLEFFDKNRTGELVDCLTSDVQEFKSAFKMVLSQGLRSITQIVGCIVSMYMLSPPLTLGMLAVVPGIIVGGTFIGSLLRSVSQTAQQQAAVVTTNCEETISNLRTVRAFANEQLECERFKEQVERAQTLYQKLGLGIALFQAGTNLFLNGMVLATLYVGGYLVAAQELNAGNLMSFLVATQTIQRSLAQLSLLFGSYVRGIQAGARVFQYVNTEEKIPLTGGKKIPFHSLVADVEFENVSFSYPTRPKQVILENFNLKLPAGKTVAIVGTSGNGKSTIAALLERFYDVDYGQIRVGGVDIRELDPSWLRGQTIGMINQEPVLFATTIMENIRYGRPDATDQEVLEAARLSNAHQFIEKFPDGYTTVLGERGVTVSGGQKQRIAIARALLKNPSILILDEATSALDTESEKVVHKALEEVCRNRTVLVIAHRLSTIQNADIIVVLNAGKIMEMGDHKSLLNMKGLYWNLMNQQNAANRGVA